MTGPIIQQIAHELQPAARAVALVDSQD